MTRRQMREILMQLIFQMEAQKNLTADDIENYITEKIADQPNKKYAKDLTEKLCENLDLIDAAINRNALKWTILADGLIAVVGSAATGLALPAVLVAGRAAVPRAELAGAGVVGVYALEEAGGSGGAWDRGGPRAAAGRVEDMRHHKIELRL